MLPQEKYRFSFREASARGSGFANANDNRVLNEGDAIAYSGRNSIELSTQSQAEILLFDLAWKK